MGFTLADVIAMQKRLSSKFNLPGGPSDDDVDAGCEVRDLHVPAQRWLKEHGLAYSYNRPDKRSTATPGVPDLAVCSPGGTVWIEFKTQTGKLSEDQQTWHFLAKRQGVKVMTVRNFNEFLALMQSCGVDI